MRIQVIRLDPNDDLISARDKLSWGKTARLLLIWPDHSNVISQRLDLAILNRFCESHGSQLGLVVTDPQIMENAQALGIPVFSSEKKALKERWRKGKRRPLPDGRSRPDFRSLRSEIDLAIFPNTGAVGRWLENRKVRLEIFILGIISVLALVSFFIPGAVITISPDLQDQGVTLTILASRQSKVVNISGVIPAREISITVEGQDEISTTGKVSIADSTASGQVLFTNLTDEEVEIPEGTIVLNIDYPLVRFQTTRSGILEAGLGNTILIPIAAVLPGKDGNLGSGRVNSIEGTVGLLLSVTNPSPTAGGSDKVTEAVNPSDYDILYNRLLETLTASALDQLKTGLSSGDVLLQNTSENVKILDNVSNPAVNEPGDELTLSMRVEFTFIYISFTDLQDLSTSNLDATLDKNYSPIPGSLHIEITDDPKIDSDQLVHLTITATRTTQINIEKSQVVNRVLGLSPKKAVEKIMDEFPVMETPEIKLSPSWWPNLPFVPLRISIMDGTYADNGG
jgi:hypothetical protein